MMAALTRFDIADRYRRLEALKGAAAPASPQDELLAERYRKAAEEQRGRQAEAARIKAGQEQRQRWADTRSPAARHEAAAREQAERVAAERAERERKLREAEADRRGLWVVERDRLTSEIAEARNAVSILGVGNTDSIPVELAEKLRVRVWLMAAEQIVEDAEAALAKHQAQRR